jgi:hypothetical protein
MVELKCACGGKACINQIRVYDDYLLVDHALGKTDMIMHTSPRKLRAFARALLRVPIGRKARK